jgi:hypothetical protein
MQLDELYPTITKKKRNSAEILNCEHPTYTINIVKFDYLPLGKPAAGNILSKKYSSKV